MPKARLVLTSSSWKHPDAFQDGETPLHLAVCHCNTKKSTKYRLDTIRVLLGFGADPSLKCTRPTAYDLTSPEKRLPYVNEGSCPDMNLYLRVGSTMLHAAGRRGQKDVFKLVSSLAVVVTIRDVNF